MVSMTVALAAEETYVPMIREGRVWEYKGEYWHPGEHGLVYHLMRFNGTAEVNGVEYHLFEVYKSIYYNSVWYDDDTYGYEFSKEEDRGYPKFLLREEPGKVYALTELPEKEGGGEYIIHIKNDSELKTISDNNADKEYGEYCLYDFTLKEGDARKMPCWEWVNPFESEYNKYFALIKNPQTIDGESCRVMSYYVAYVDEPFNPEWSQSEHGTAAFQMIEGIGVTRYGCIPHFYPEIMTAMYHDNSYLPEFNSRLNYVYDNEGNVIYFSQYSSPAGVDNIANTTNPQSGVIYDLMGRRVERVQPGSVYVRDGRKFVGR